MGMTISITLSLSWMVINPWAVFLHGRYMQVRNKVFRPWFMWRRLISGQKVEIEESVNNTKKAKLPATMIINSSTKNGYNIRSFGFCFPVFSLAWMLEWVFNCEIHSWPCPPLLSALWWHQINNAFPSEVGNKHLWSFAVNLGHFEMMSVHFEESGFVHVCPRRR